MKKIILLMLFAALSWQHAVAQSFTYGGLLYDVTSPTTVKVAMQNQAASGVVTIPSQVTFNFVNYSVTSIADRAFLRCYFLTSVTIPDSVTSISDLAFYGCFSLTSITIPNAVTNIGAYAFYSCSGFTSFTIPNSITNIGEFAFYSCSGLTSVTIPNSVTNIGQFAFLECSGLSSVICNIENPLLIDYSVFYGVNQATCSLIVPNSSVGNYETAPYWNVFSPILCPNPSENIRTISACGTYTWDNNGATYTTSGVKIGTVTNCVIEKLDLTITDPPTFFTVGCINYELTSSNTVAVSINAAATGTIVIPASITTACGTFAVTSISDYAFLNCSGLTSVICNIATPLSLSSTAFEGVNLNACSLTVPADSLDAYQNAGIWQSFSTIVANVNDMTTITTCEFLNPTAVNQSFYSSDNATVANLVATGINLNWYDVATGGTALLSDTLLSTNTYYVSQNENGFESNRTAVNITIIQCTSIPDQNFEQALIDLGYDNVIDGRVITSNINAIETLDISFKGILSFTGLQDFVNLRNLNIQGNNQNNWWAPINLDVSGLTNLQYLYCGGNRIESLNVTGLSNLNYLECTYNLLVTLDLTGLYNLRYLFCGGNQLTSLNVNGSPRLSYLNCDHNNLSTLDLSRLIVFPNGTTPLLFSFSSLYNYDLYCIQVATLGDANVNTRWHKDDWASYANNCSGIAEPIADAQSFCNSANVSNLVAIGDNLKWYTVLTGGTPLAAVTALTSATYFVSQTINGTEGPRKAVNVTVSLNIIPSFATVAPICSGGILATLPTTSTNGIVGTWNSALNNTETTTYTFTPNEGICAVTNTLTITVNPNVTPTFDSIAPICSGATLAALPTTSTNGIAGTWSPALSNTETKTYTFTPNAGQCSATSTLTITVIQNVTPIFNAVAPICSGGILSVLPTTSNNGIAGTWSPAMNNTATTTYTFTPNVGQCASATTLIITVTPKVMPTFIQIPPLCPNATLQPLPTTSTNGITGTWNLTVTDANNTRQYTFTPSIGQCAEKTTMVIFRMPAINAGVVTGGTSVCNGVLSDVLTLNGANGPVVRWESSTDNFSTKTIIGNTYSVYFPVLLNVTTKFRAVVDSGCGAAISGSTTVVMLPAVVSPTALKLTDNAINNSNPITIVSKYIGTNTPLTLTATPVTGATAYNWELPQGVNQTAGGTSNVITINFVGVAPGTTSMYLGAKAKIGNCISTRSNSGLSPDTGSTARVLLITASLPTAPTNITLTNNGTTITDLGKYVGTNISLTLTANPSANANSYEWELPSGVNQLSGGSTNTISINLLAVPAGTMWLYFGVKAKNGTGISVTDNSILFPGITSSARLLRVQAKFPSSPSAITLTNNGMNVTNFGKYIGTSSALTLTATPVANANSYVWELPTGVNLISGGTTNLITVNFAGVAEGTTSLYLGAKAKNGVGVSIDNNNNLSPPTSSTASLIKVLASVPIAPTALTLTYNGTTVSDFGEYIGTTNTLTLTANESVNANSYVWELPSGVNKTSGGNTNTISINFAEVTEATTTLYLGVIAKNGVGISTINNSALVPTTSSTARLLKVSTTLPASPAALILTTFGNNLEVVTNVSKFIGTQDNLRLTATPSPTAASYEWELPAGVNKLTGGNTNVITVNFWNVAPGTTSMYIGVKAKNAVGVSKRNNSTLSPPTSSTAKLLKVTASIPASPTRLQLLTFDDNIITDFGKYIGTTEYITLKSNLPPNATGFQWELPAGVNQMTNSGRTDEIYVNCAGVPDGTTTLYFGVKAKNGVGVSSTDNSAVLPATSSKAKLLKLTASPPSAPTSITLQDINSGIKASNLGAYIGTDITWTLTAAESAKASSYLWELPAGVNQISGGTSSSIKVNFAGVAPGTTSMYIGVKAKNGIGISTTDNSNLLPATNSTARLLKLTPSLPPMPQVSGTSESICAGSVYRYQIFSSPLATSYIITAPVGSRVTSANKLSNLTNVLATSDLFFDVLIPANFNTLTTKTVVITAVNGVGNSLVSRTYTLSENLPQIPFVSSSSNLPNFKRCGTQTYTALSVEGATNYLWEVTNGAVIVGDSNKQQVVINFSAVPTSATTNVIKVKAVSACGNFSAVKSTTLTSVSCRTTDEEAITLPTETNLYPNPTKGDFKLDITALQAGTLDIEIYTINGVTVKSRKAIILQEGANTIDENISDLADGLYFVRLTNNANNEVTIKRLIKQ